jgi:general L-amino acid transport system permease protein
VKGVFLCNRGLIFAVPEPHPVYGYMLICAAAAAGIIYVMRRWARKRQARTGQSFPVLRVSVALSIGMPLAIWLAGGAPLTMDYPELIGFNFQGGITLSPEFMALLLGLVLYTAALACRAIQSSTSRAESMPTSFPDASTTGR